MPLLYKYLKYRKQDGHMYYEREITFTPYLSKHFTVFIHGKQCPRSIWQRQDKNKDYITEELKFPTQFGPV